jgi:nitrite reductase (NADH) large subunit
MEREANMNYVILGNGVAGIHAAETIRQLDPNGKITMISDEVFPPYCRPMISMVLEGSVPPEKLPIRPSSFYEEFKIEPVLGNRVSAVDADNRAVSVNGKVYPYDKLLIATGADPRRMKAEGLELKNIFFMRTETHVRQMLATLPTVRKALVLGGGLVGFKASYGLLRRGIQVTMLIRSGYPLSMQVDPEAGRLIW